MNIINEYKNSDRTEYYFKDEINWKMFNYIHDKMIYFDAAEYDYIISVCIYYKKNEELLNIYNYTASTGNGTYTGDDYLAEKRERYNGKNLVFVINLCGKEVRNEMLQKINASNKFEILDFDFVFAKTNIVLKPR